MGDSESNSCRGNNRRREEGENRIVVYKETVRNPPYRFSGKYYRSAKNLFRVISRNLPMEYRARGACLLSPPAARRFRKNKNVGYSSAGSRIGEKAIGLLGGLYLVKGGALGLPAQGRDSR